ncbi:putative Si dkeyp-35f12.3 [Trypoxylus dichotomus]
MITDKIIEKLPKIALYKTDNTHFNAICYADGAVLIANSEDSFQRLLHTFNQSEKQQNMIINTDKTKCLVTSKGPVKCKLEVDQRMIEQVNQFRYLRADITRSGDPDSEVREQTMEASQISD